MKLKVVFFLILSTIYIGHLDAQIKNGKFIYKAKSNFSKSLDDSKAKKEAKSYMIKLHKAIDESLRNIEFELLFSKGESIFKAVDKLDLNRTDRLAISTIGGKGVFYLNSKTDEKLHQKIAFGKQFLIKGNIGSIEWKFFNEKQNILGYNCFKATTTKIVQNSKGIFKKKVIAWYAPEIAVPFGPIGYTGLPGLIIKLDIENEATFNLIKLDLNLKKSVVIKKPTKGKVVSNSEYKEIVDKSGNWVRKKKN